MIESFLKQVMLPPPERPILAAVSPHAGYVYSGPVAGFVFRALQDAADRFGPPDTAIVLGFSHRTSFPGIAWLEGDAFSTPLGETPLDRETVAAMLATDPLHHSNPSPHAGEHSAENQIPFVQVALPNTRLAVGLTGDHSRRTIQALVKGLEATAAFRRIVVIASSDMLHDPDYDLVTRTDRGTLRLIEAMDTEGLLQAWRADHQILCGIIPVAAALGFAARQGVRRAEILHYRNSGDDHPESRGEWVVGYGAVVCRS